MRKHRERHGLPLRNSTCRAADGFRRRANDEAPRCVCDKSVPAHNRCGFHTRKHGYGQRAPPSIALIGALNLYPYLRSARRKSFGLALIANVSTARIRQRVLGYSPLTRTSGLARRASVVPDGTAIGRALLTSLARFVDIATPCGPICPRACWRSRGAPQRGAPVCARPRGRQAALTFRHQTFGPAV
jgi:hypothetical protein